MMAAPEDLPAIERCPPAVPARRRRRRSAPKLVPLDKAILNAAQEAASRFGAEGARERLGQSWVDAKLKSVENRASPSVQRASGVMHEIAEAAIMAASMIDEPCDPWPAMEPTTPHDEFEAAMRDRWIRSMIHAADDRNSVVLAMALGLDDRPMSMKEIAEVHGISRSAVAVKVDAMVTRLSRAWARVQREAAFLINGTTPPEACGVEADDADDIDIASPSGQRHRRPKRTSAPAPAPSNPTNGPGRPKSVEMTDGTLRIGGLVIRRHGDDAYRIEGSTKTLDAAGIAMAIRNVMSDDAFARRRYNVEAYDTYVADEMRAIMRKGPVWPTKAVLRIALPITRAEEPA
jgi:hypothetical protein